MKLSETEQNFLLKSFPNIELSYETIVHKKVYNSNYVLTIPEGQKCFAWFTIFKTQNVCVLLEISENKRISRINIVSACFQQELSYGTIFYGTFFSCKNKRYFATEDIYYYKGTNVAKNVFKEKLAIFKTIFTSEIKQLSYFENNIIFGLPIISNSCEEILRTVAVLPYKTKHIQFRSDNDAKINNLPYPISDTHVENICSKPPYRNYLKREIVFKIKPDIQNDIYHLHYYDNNSSENIFDVAYIPDYKTSVMMNRLFRKIKENANLDSLEESDDEAEFEDDRPDKFVFLEKSYNMICSWNNKFKKWAPLRLAQKGDKIITKKELSYYERK
jgi:hypothetical protein